MQIDRPPPSAHKLSTIARVTSADPCRSGRIFWYSAEFVEQPRGIAALKLDDRKAREGPGAFQHLRLGPAHPVAAAEAVDQRRHRFAVALERGGVVYLQLRHDVSCHFPLPVAQSE